MNCDCVALRISNDFTTIKCLYAVSVGCSDIRVAKGRYQLVLCFPPAGEQQGEARDH